VGLVTIFYSLRFETRRAMVEVFVPASTRETDCSQSQSQSYVTIDGQSASLSWNKAPIWGLRPHLYYCQIVPGLLMWGALSDERTGLSFARVTVSSNTCKSVVLDLVSKWLDDYAESESYVTTDGQPASLSWNKASIWGLRPDLFYLDDSYGLVLVGRPL
jgi:hypothetical protein